MLFYIRCCFRYCLRLYAKSPSAYKTLGEVLVLPSPTTLRQERNIICGTVVPGLQKDLISRLEKAAEITTDAHQQIAVFIIDEMAIKGKFHQRSSGILSY